MNTHLIKHFIAILLAIGCGQAFAGANLLMVGDADHMTYYIDTQSIKKNGQFARVWSWIEYKTAKQNGYLLAKSVQSLEEFDCKEDKRRYLSQTQFSGSMGQGDRHSIDLSNERWAYIPPNTISETIEKLVCKQK